MLHTLGKYLMTIDSRSENVAVDSEHLPTALKVASAFWELHGEGIVEITPEQAAALGVADQATKRKYIKRVRRITARNTTQDEAIAGLATCVTRGDFADYLAVATGKTLNEIKAD
jgi:hypothetical protein